MPRVYCRDAELFVGAAGLLLGRPIIDSQPQGAATWGAAVPIHKHSQTISPALRKSDRTALRG
jgi:hypothetical protein